METGGEVTRLLGELNRGNPEAMDQLMPLVYHELHAIASRYFGRERRTHTMQATALVNEAYIRLVDQNVIDWESRLHFLSIAAVMMRRILVDYARSHKAVRRGDGVKRVSLHDAMAICEQREVEMIALDQALTCLAEMDPVQARVVELRFFGGLSVEETADALKISTPTVKRYWQSARAWLRAQITKGGAYGRGAVGAS